MVEIACFGRRYRVGVLPACVACDADEIVGIASYAWDEDATVNLVTLNVVPRWQGRGVARWLIAMLIDIVRTGGARRLVVATTNDNLPALAFYQRLGFAISNIVVGGVIEHCGQVRPGFASIPVRDEIQLELCL
jgi:GNAT superfamily N-acetyltransferase